MNERRALTLALTLLAPVSASAETTFETFREFETGVNSPIEIQSADLNGDLNPDIIASGVGHDPYILAVLYGDGMGNFADPVGLNVDAVGYFRVLDVDSDNDIDVVVSNYFPPEIALFVNDGSGVFDITITPVRSGLGPLTPGDFDGDGDPDFAVFQYEAPNNRLVLLVNDGAGGFSIVETPLLVQSSAVNIHAGDMDCDGDLDLVRSTGIGPDIEVLVNKGGGIFSIGATFEVDDEPDGDVRFNVGDLDNDGDLDLLTHHNDGFSVLLNDCCSNEFSLGWQDGLFPLGSRIALADIDGDRTVDAVIDDALGVNNFPAIAILLNDGNALYSYADSWQTAAATSGSDSLTPATADLDADGDLDVIRLHGQLETIGVLINTTIVDPVPETCVADANGDGTVDPLDAGFVLAQLGCDVCGDNMFCLAADVNADDVVDPLDAGFILARFGTCPGACCEATIEPGCIDTEIESCVCALDTYCCKGSWDELCVIEIESFGCGACPN